MAEIKSDLGWGGKYLHWTPDGSNTLVDVLQSLRTDVDALRTAVIAILTKLDGETDVTNHDTDYVSTSTPPALTTTQE